MVRGGHVGDYYLALQWDSQQYVMQHDSFLSVAVFPGYLCHEI